VPTLLERRHEREQLPRRPLVGEQCVDQFDSHTPAIDDSLDLVSTRSGRAAPGAAHTKRVLLLEDDPPTSDAIVDLLHSTSLEVVPVLDARHALAAASRCRFDLLLVDLGLPDLPGLEVVRRLRAQDILTPFIVISGFASPPHVVEARMLGALTFFEKPLPVNKLIEAINSVLWSPFRPNGRAQPVSRALASTGGSPAGLSGACDCDPHSPVGRWGLFVLKAMHSDRDLKTLDQWAQFVGVSRSMLCESCRLVHVSPHDARDFARVLRALWRSGGKWQPEVDLDVADARTLRRLEWRAGLTAGKNIASLTIEEFFERQRMISRDSLVLPVFRHMLNLPIEKQSALLSDNVR
jgi:CheY-like chemotaxis protein